MSNLNKEDTTKLLNVSNCFISDILSIWSEVNFEDRIMSENQFHDQCLWYNSLFRINSLASTMTDIGRSHPCENWMMISHHFPHLQTLFGLHPRLSWEKKGQIQLDNIHEHGKLLRPLAVPMVEETSRKVQQLITVLHNEHHINEMTEK